jgi:hypothetical protein
VDARSRRRRPHLHAVLARRRQVLAALVPADAVHLARVDLHTIRCIINKQSISLHILSRPFMCDPLPLAASVSSCPSRCRSCSPCSQPPQRGADRSEVGTSLCRYHTVSPVYRREVLLSLKWCKAAK